MQEAGGGGGCMTGNPIDDCWRCAGTDWRQDRQRLADCGIGFGRNALGGKGGPLYVVTDSSDRDPVNPVPGTLRHAAIQEGPLWIVFAADMTIRLNEELLVNSYKTIDGRGARVHIGAGGACITLQYVSNVIVHNVHVHDCVPAGNANVRSSPTHYGWRTRSDGDGISLFGARDVWVDHCALWRCADGLVDAIEGSTAITVSNSYFAHHDEVMLLGASDAYLPDSGMQVTIAFNRFGPGLVQRMPRCRRGYFHIVNNDYTSWEMYAIGGSASPTINSQGNRYIAPGDPNAKEVRAASACVSFLSCHAVCSFFLSFFLFFFFEESHAVCSWLQCRAVLCSRLLGRLLSLLAAPALGFAPALLCSLLAEESTGTGRARARLFWPCLACLLLPVSVLESYAFLGSRHF
jgi:pectate lyase